MFLTTFSDSGGGSAVQKTTSNGQQLRLSMLSNQAEHLSQSVRGSQVFFGFLPAAVSSEKNGLVGLFAVYRGDYYIY